LYIAGLLHRTLKLEELIIVNYAPYHSRYNEVEKFWGFMSKKLAGYVLGKQWA